MADTGKITVLEGWFKRDGIVYRVWSLDGGKTWKPEPTALPEVPYIEIPIQG